MENLIDKVNKIQQKIGKTPLIALGNNLYGKLESKNLAGSIKDRLAFYIIKDAAEKGLLNDGGIIVEATSGNTGIGLAYIAKLLGLKAVLTMPESMSQERRDMLKSYGAELRLTTASEGMNGSVKLAKEIVGNTKNAYFANQFGNTAGITAHFETTAPEIFLAKPNVKYIVAGVGSGGTIMGIKKYIDENGKNCNVVAVEPSSSPLMSEGRAGSHKIQGIGANFIPEIVDVKKIDKIMTVSNECAFEHTRLLYKTCGEKCGISSGAAYAVGLELSKQNDGEVVVILPDGGDRYSPSLYGD